MSFYSFIQQILYNSVVEGLMKVFSPVYNVRLLQWIHYPFISTLFWALEIKCIQKYSHPFLYDTTVVQPTGNRWLQLVFEGKCDWGWISTTVFQLCCT